MFIFSLVACLILLSRPKEDHKSGEQIVTAYGSKLPPRPSEHPFGSGGGVVVCGGDAKKKSTKKTRAVDAAAFVAAAVGDVPQEKKKRNRKRKHVDSSSDVAVAVVTLIAGRDGNGGGHNTGSRDEGKARVAVKPTKAAPACRLFGKFVVVPFAFGDAPPVDWIGHIVAEKAGRIKGEVYFQALFEEDGQKVWYEQQEVGNFFFAVPCD